jgi:RNA polymerase sigma factor (sigma-70 family)
MEASTVPRAAPAGISGVPSPRLLRVATDARLVELIRQGRASAFETLYDRHHRSILSFCRHMLGSAEEAEDAVQHTFLSAYNDLIATDRPMHLRAWLFTIARNRCYSILRARREQPVADLDEPVTEGLAAQVERRQDLRDLVLDLGRLPEDQRAALVLSEMDALSHEQIASVLDVPKDKVKALVFQARESLIASRAARETDCAVIREQLANLSGGALRRANLRRHLRECPGCRDFRAEVDSQRRQLRLLLPVVPTIALKEAVLGATVGGSATATAIGGGTIATSVFKGGVIKSLIGAAIAGVGTAGTIVAVHDFQLSAGGNLHSGRHITSARRPSARPAHAASATPAAVAANRPDAATSAPASVATSSPPVVVSTGGRQETRTSTTTLVAVLHPLSPKGLTGTKQIVSPLLPSAPVTGVTPSQPTAPQTPTTSGNAPYLGAGAFGTGTQPAPTAPTPSSSTPSGSSTSTSGSSQSTPPTSVTPIASTHTPTPTSSTTSHGSSSGSGGHFANPVGGTPSSHSGSTTTGHTGTPSSSGSSSAEHSSTSSGSSPSTTQSSTPSSTTSTTTTTSSTPPPAPTQPTGDGGRSGGTGDPGTSTGTGTDTGTGTGDSGGYGGGTGGGGGR